jgi:hypothetical protein
MEFGTRLPVNEPPDIITHTVTMNNNNNKLNQNFVSGFADAEGCFRISMIKNKNYKSSQPN